MAKKKIGAAHLIAALYRCRSCQAWWGGHEAEEPDAPPASQPEAHLLFHLAEAHPELFLWEKYRGWRTAAAGADVCPDCGAPINRPKFSLVENLGVNGSSSLSPTRRFNDE
jgi:hypothetical protein